MITKRLHSMQAHAQEVCRVKTYHLDSSSGIHGAMYVEERVEYHSDHRDGYTPHKAHVQGVYIG